MKMVWYRLIVGITIILNISAMDLHNLPAIYHGTENLGQTGTQIFQAIARDDASWLESIKFPTRWINFIFYDACGYDAPKCIEFLIRSGADVNYYDGMNNTTPLWHALLYMQFNIAEILWAHGANVNQLVNRRAFLSDNCPETMLCFFSSTNKNAPKRVEWLLAHNADPNIPQKGTTTTPLWLVCKPLRYFTLQEAQIKVALAKMLVDAGAQIDTRGGDYETTPFQESQKGEVIILANFLTNYMKKIKIK